MWKGPRQQPTVNQQKQLRQLARLPSLTRLCNNNLFRHVNFHGTVAHFRFTPRTVHGNVRTQTVDLLLFPQPRTMSAQLSRKRSRSATDSDDDEAQGFRQASPALSSFSDILKRSKTQCELDELDIIEPTQAWTVDVGAVLASATLAAPPGSGLKPHNNWQRYQKNESILVLCVQGNLQLHYNLLWYV